MSTGPLFGSGEAKRKPTCRVPNFEKPSNQKPPRAKPVTATKAIAPSRGLGSVSSGPAMAPCLQGRLRNSFLACGGMRGVLKRHMRLCVYVCVRALLFARVQAACCLHFEIESKATLAGAPSHEPTVASVPKPNHDACLQRRTWQAGHLGTAA